MRSARQVLLLPLVLALLALGGCYTSETLLLDPAASVRILATGPQTSLTPGEGPEQVTVVALPGGWYRVDRGEEEPTQMLFTPLRGLDGRFAVAFEIKGVFVYGLAFRQGQRIALELVNCSDETAAAVAAKHAARMVQRDCQFTDGAALTGALSELAALPPDEDLPSLPAAP